VSALITALYMTRMMLYTFHGPNRTGEAERRHLHEVGWRMALPLAVLGVATAVAGWLNLPELLHAMGPAEGLGRWLEPVVGSAGARLAEGRATVSHATEYGLIGAATAAGVLGIVAAVVLLKPAALRPKAESPAEEGTAIERVLAHKYYVDEAYDAAIVRPTLLASRRVLFQGIDIGIIDRLFVTGLGQQVPRLLSYAGSRLQTGQVGRYAWVLLAGVVLVVGAFTLR